MSARAQDHRSPQSARLRRWMPLLIIGAIYVAAIVVNEWRLQQHVQELRDRTPAQIGEAPPLEPAALAEAG